MSAATYCASLTAGRRVASRRRLPERDRQIVYLRFFEDLSQSDIARQVGVSQMQVSRILIRTLRVLHDELAA